MKDQIIALGEKPKILTDNQRSGGLLAQSRIPQLLHYWMPRKEGF